MSARCYEQPPGEGKCDKKKGTSKTQSGGGLGVGVEKDKRLRKATSGPAKETNESAFKRHAQAIWGECCFRKKVCTCREGRPPKRRKTDR